MLYFILFKMCSCSPSRCFFFILFVCSISLLDWLLE